MSEKANARQVGGDHYKSQLEHWDYVEKNGLRYLEGCATKYVTRWRKKNGVEDLKKAVHYIQKLIELHVQGEIQPRRVPGLRGWILRFRGYPAPLRIYPATFAEANSLGATEYAVLRILSVWTDANQLRLAKSMVEGLVNRNTSGH